MPDSIQTSDLDAYINNMEDYIAEHLSETIEFPYEVKQSMGNITESLKMFEESYSHTIFDDTNTLSDFPLYDNLYRHNDNTYSSIIYRIKELDNMREIICKIKTMHQNLIPDNRNIFIFKNTLHDKWPSTEIKYITTFQNYYIAKILLYLVKSINTYNRELQSYNSISVPLTMTYSISHSTFSYAYDILTALEKLSPKPFIYTKTLNDCKNSILDNCKRFLVDTRSKKEKRIDKIKDAGENSLGCLIPIAIILIIILISYIAEL